MFCASCGSEIVDGGAFCPGCGAAVGTPATPAATDTAQPAPAAAEAAAPAPTQQEAPAAAATLPTAANDAPQATQESKGNVLWGVAGIVIIALIAIFLFQQCSGGGQHALESDMTQSQLQQEASSYETAINAKLGGLAKCTATAKASGNTLIVDAQFNVDIDSLVGMNYMQLYEGVGADRAIADLLFSAEETERAVNLCKQSEEEGYQNTTVVATISDSTGSKIASRTFTSSGYQ